MGEQAKEVARHRQAQAHSIRMSVLENNLTNNQAMPCDGKQR